MSNKLNSYNPANGDLVGQVDITPVEQIPLIVKHAQDAQKHWGALPIDERIAYIVKATKGMESKTQPLGELLSKEMGKNFERSSNEVFGCSGDAAYRTKEVKDAIKTQVFKNGGRETQLQYNPLGVCAIIAPWNYPMSMAHWMIIPALAAGNTVILKPSEETPLIAQSYVDTLNEILPTNVLQIVQGAEEQGRALVDSAVNFIGFTGSREVGKEIVRKSAETLKRVMMELGGNDPLIVMKDADLRQAAYFATGNSFENAGQMCIATERIYVDATIAETFEILITDVASQYKIGSWDDESAHIGPIINNTQRDIIISHIEDAVSKGAKVLLGGTEHPERYIKPTVLTDVTPDMLIAKEETFGPLICISKFNEIDEAIAMANDSEYGLGASVFGTEGVEIVGQQIEAGMIGINQGIGGLGDTPWVGAKQSGLGYHGSPDGHRQFTQARVVTINHR
jgi:acyl-CoA reductase-like NAD-dependent aldehyde dehydrogenase